MAALDRELADLPHEVSRSEAGLHLLLHMRNGMLEHELIERAKASGVRVYPLSAYYTPPVKPPRATLVLGYAGLTEQRSTRRQSGSSKRGNKINATRSAINFCENL